MSFFDSFERKFLFHLTRGLAMLFIFGLIAVIVVGALIAYSSLLGNTVPKVDPSEVIEAIKPPVYVQETITATSTPPKAAIPDPNMLPGIKLPFALQKQFNTPDNIRALRNILNDIPKENQQEFIDEMAAVVAEVEKQNLNTYEAINKFVELKKNKLAKDAVSKVDLQQTRLYFAGAAVSAIILIALFSLILVLLAIERNTRQVIP